MIRFGHPPPSLASVSLVAVAAASTSDASGQTARATGLIAFA